MASPEALIRDFVFPLIIAKKIGKGEVAMVSFLGTGFLIGSRGFALTASHVVKAELPEDHAIVGMFVEPASNSWKVWNADVCDHHTTEDVALLKMRDGNWPDSAFTVSFEKQFSALPYMLFGYPSANLYEKVNDVAPDGTVRGRPDLIYSAGHIRRRATFAIPGVRGTNFYELSQPVGRGCSGSPVFRARGQTWEVVGIYVADQAISVPFETLDKNLDPVIRTLEMPGALAYAVRMDALAGWCPNVLNANLSLA